LNDFTYTTLQYEQQRISVEGGDTVKDLGVMSDRIYGLFTPWPSRSLEL